MSSLDGATLKYFDTAAVWNGACGLGGAIRFLLSTRHVRYVSMWF
jgi:hypothetical protein